MVTTGLNPSMLTVLQQTWGWPSLMVFFNCESHTFALFSAMLIRKRWVSLPHCDQGALWIDRQFLEVRGINPDKHFLLFKKLVSIAINAVSSDQLDPNNLLDLDFTINELHQFILDYDTDPSYPWFIRSTMPINTSRDPFKVINELTLDPLKDVFEQLPHGPRHKIRKSIRNQLVVVKGTGNLLQRFYPEYMKRMHQLGSFGLPYLFFSNIFRFYKHGEANIFICFLDDKIIGASILLKFLDYSENMWFFTDPAYNNLYPSYALHHEMISDSLASGCRKYSMGRSTKGGKVQHYKSQFGGESKDLHYSYFPSGRYLRVTNPLISAVIKNLPLKASFRLCDTIAKYWF
jgi:hypothetical protein